MYLLMLQAILIWLLMRSYFSVTVHKQCHPVEKIFQIMVP